MENMRPANNLINQLDPVASHEAPPASLNLRETVTGTAYDIVPQTQSEGYTPPSGAVLRFVKAFIRKQARKGCGLIRNHETQTGNNPCTLGWRRSFKNSADLFRHEEIVYSQSFWYCKLCSAHSHPSENHLFTREDKIRAHMKRYHSEGPTVASMRVSNIVPATPESCRLCSHFKHGTWKESCKHIVWPYKRGDRFPPTARSQASTTTDRHILSLANDNDKDDEDDENDNDDEDDDSNDNGHHSGTHRGQ